MTPAALSAQEACAQAGAALEARDPYAALSLYAYVISMTGRFAREDCTVPDTSPATGQRWAQRLLLLGAVAAGTAGPRDLAEQTLTTADELAGQVCLVVGTTDSGIAMPDAEILLAGGFAGFTGTVISGGTDQGAAGLVARLGEEHPDRLRTVGYIPQPTAQVDRRYHRLVFTDGPDFSPWEALQAWTDLLAAGVSPAQVRVLGLGGGRISAAEYRIALALGASVGVVHRLGRAGIALLDDPIWGAHPRLQCLPWDGQAVQAFLAHQT